MKPTGVPYSSGALRMLAALVASSDEAVLAKTLDGIITAWNPGAERLYGYSALEAIGQSVRLIVPPEQFPELDVILARLNRGERIEHYETERVRKDGERLTIRVTVYPVKDPTGRIVGASATAREVTGQAPSRQSLHEREEEVRRLVEADVRAAQRALAESESRCRMLAETSHDALILSVNGRVREVNVEFERTFGWSVNEVVGIPITEFADQTVREDVERRIAASIEGSYELIGRHRSGRKLLFEVTARNLLIDGQVGRLTALRDVTEKRQLELPRP